MYSTTWSSRHFGLTASSEMPASPAVNPVSRACGSTLAVTSAIAAAVRASSAVPAIMLPSIEPLMSTASWAEYRPFSVEVKPAFAGPFSARRVLARSPAIASVSAIFVSGTA